MEFSGHRIPTAILAAMLLLTTGLAQLLAPTPMTAPPTARPPLAPPQAQSAPPTVSTPPPSSHKSPTSPPVSSPPSLPEVPPPKPSTESPPLPPSEGPFSTPPPMIAPFPDSPSPSFLLLNNTAAVSTGSWSVVAGVVTVAAYLI